MKDSYSVSEPLLAQSVYVLPTTVLDPTGVPVTGGAPMDWLREPREIGPSGTL